LKKLAAREAEAGDAKSSAATLTKLLYIYPEDQELHRRFGDLLLARNDTAGAIREYNALIATKPLDPAESHFQLARAYRAANRIDDAKEEVLQALETAPGFRPAQQLLLELSK
jgi:Flp pilus assembly protein TadD